MADILHRIGIRSSLDAAYNALATRDGLAACGPDAHMLYNLGVLLEDLGRKRDAAQAYEQALANFFRKGNLSTLRELALRVVADEVGEKAADYRAREGLEPNR